MAREISKAGIPHFPGLVLFCIDTSDSESRRIFQHFFEIYKIADCHTFAPLQCLFFLRFFFIEFRGFLETFADFSAYLVFFAANIMEFCRNCGKLERQNNFSFSSWKRENGGHGKEGK